MSANARVLTSGRNRGEVASKLLALAEAMDLPVSVVGSRAWGYEVPVDLAIALADLEDDLRAKAAKKMNTPVIVSEAEVPAPTPPKRAAGRPAKS